MVFYLKIKITSNFPRPSWHAHIPSPKPFVCTVLSEPLQNSDLASVLGIHFDKAGHHT